MHTLVKKSLSLFFALTLLFSPLAGVYLAPKAEAQIGGAIAGCLGGFLAGLVGSFLSFLSVPVGDGTNNTKECLDAIGYALAKTLLAKMTDSIVNWINGGFEGNPFYIGDTGSFFKNIIRDELQIALDDLKRTGTIYFDILRQEAIYKARLTLRDQIGFTLDSDIVNAVCGYAQYENYKFCSEQLTPESRAELSYAFTRGYLPFQWSTWDSLTQNCGNNIFCSNSYATNYQLSLRQERIQQLNNDLNRSGGFLNQEVCADPGFERDLENWNAEVETYAVPPADDFVGPPEPADNAVADQIAAGTFPPRPVCNQKIIKTPGRTIADKLTHSLGTSDRQLELADELNESIAAIFDALIGKLISDGLSSFKGNNGNGNTSDDAYYQSLNRENNGFEYEPTTDILSRDQESCEIAGGTYDSELEVCDFEEPTSENQQGGFPQFPWTLDDETIIENDQGLATYINTHLGQCIQIDELRIVDGTEPCVLGVSSSANGDNTGDGNPGPIDGGGVVTNCANVVPIGGLTRQTSFFNNQFLEGNLEWPNGPTTVTTLLPWYEGHNPSRGTPFPPRTGNGTLAVQPGKYMALKFNTGTFSTANYGTGANNHYVTFTIISPQTGAGAPLTAISTCPGEFTALPGDNTHCRGQTGEGSLVLAVASTDTSACQLQENTDYYLNVAYVDFANPTTSTCSNPDAGNTANPGSCHFFMQPR